MSQSKGNNAQTFAQRNPRRNTFLSLRQFLFTNIAKQGLKVYADIFVGNSMPVYREKHQSQIKITDELHLHGKYYLLFPISKYCPLILSW